MFESIHFAWRIVRNYMQYRLYSTRLVDLIHVKPQLVDESFFILLEST